MGGNFAGAAPAQQLRALRRKDLAQEFSDSISRIFKNAKVGAVTPCPAWGSDEEVDICKEMLKATTSERRTLSESLGEQAGIYMLLRTLHANKIPYEDSCLHIFSGPNVFNVVYVYPSLKKPQGVVIIETKGGNSQCGWRNSPLYGGRVKQGTEEYAETEAYIMASSGKADVSDVGNAIEACLGKNPSKVVYVGVRAPYNRKKSKVYDPEVFFMEEV